MMTKRHQANLRIDLELICYGYVLARLFKMPRMKNYGAICFKDEKGRDKKAIKNIYGGIFLVKQPEIAFQRLDALYSCSLSTTGHNLPSDNTHRIIKPIEAITFVSLLDFVRMKYNEPGVIDAYLYKKNYTIPDTRKNHRWVIKNQIFGKAFKQMHKEADLKLLQSIHYKSK